MEWFHACLFTLPSGCVSISHFSSWKKWRFSRGYFRFKFLIWWKKRHSGEILHMCGSPQEVPLCPLWFLLVPSHFFVLGLESSESMKQWLSKLSVVSPSFSPQHSGFYKKPSKQEDPVSVVLQPQSSAFTWQRPCGSPAVHRVLLSWQPSCLRYPWMFVLPELHVVFWHFLKRFSSFNLRIVQGLIVSASSQTLFISISWKTEPKSL